MWLALVVARSPSLGILLDLVHYERDDQPAHVDTLDDEAGIVLAVSGRSITLAPDVPTVGVGTASAHGRLCVIRGRHRGGCDPRMTDARDGSRREA